MHADAVVFCKLSGGLDQPALADPGLTLYHEQATGPGCHVEDSRCELLKLATPADNPAAPSSNFAVMGHSNEPPIATPVETVILFTVEVYQGWREFTLGAAVRSPIRKDTSAMIL